MSEFAFDTSIQDFETKAIQPAETVPVVVDFWAPWCEPCKVLKPLLEKLAEEYKGRFLLAMVNADENPELSQHFGVRSIPSVKVLFQGQLVDEFNGALPESQLREFLDRIALPAGPGGNLREEAAALVIEGKLEEALAKLVDASKAKPDDQAIQLDAVDVMMQLGRNDEAGQLLSGDYTQEADRANALRARLALAAGAADTAELQAKLAANPADHGVRLDLSRAYAADIAGQPIAAADIDHLASAHPEAYDRHVRIIDRDFIEHHNLQRQVLFDEDDVASFRVCLNNTANAEQCRAGDFNGDGRVDCADAQALIAAWPGPAPAPEFTACRGAVAVSIPALHPTLLMLLGLLLAGMALRQLKATLKS